MLAVADLNRLTRNAPAPVLAAFLELETVGLLLQNPHPAQTRAGVTTAPGSHVASFSGGMLVDTIDGQTVMIVDFVADQLPS